MKKSHSRQNLKLFLTVFIISAFVLGLISYANGQTTTTQKVEEVKQQVEANSSQLDSTSLATVGGIGIGALALAREYMNTKKLKKEDRGTDRDTGYSLLIRYRLIQAMEVYVPGMKEALDQPFNTDTMQKDVTIRKKISEDAQAWAEYMMTVLQAFPPSMTPSTSVQNASPPPPPPPPTEVKKPETAIAAATPNTTTTPK